MKYFGWFAIIAAYLLTLLTQLPHIYDVYSALEKSEHSLFGLDTALGASIAFEASVAIFTVRIIVNRKTERSKWTRPGVVFFLLLSVLANASYYFDLALMDNIIMPGALTIAIPLALWLYAEEFGTEARVAIRQQQRDTRKATDAYAQATRSDTQADVVSKKHTCWCGEAYEKQQSLATHTRRHKREVRVADSIPDALIQLKAKYPNTEWENKPVSVEQIEEWRK